MSTRERARPWWRDPLPPFEDTPLGRTTGDGSISFTVQAAPLCANCGETLHGNHYAMHVDYHFSLLFCTHPSRESMKRLGVEAGATWRQM